MRGGVFKVPISFKSHNIVHCLETRFDDDTLAISGEMEHTDMPAWIRTAVLRKGVSMDELFDAHDRTLNAHEAMAKRERIIIAGKGHYFELVQKTRARLAELNEAYYEAATK